MSDHRIEFEKLHYYDVGENGITIDVAISLSDKYISRYLD